MFEPILIAMCAAIAFICFFAGWFINGSGSQRRENDLKRDIIEAKRSIPQLESSVRNRETHIAQLQGEVRELSERTGELHRNLEATGMDLRRATREARNVTSELEIVKGTRVDTGNVIMDGFDDDEPDTTEDGKLAAQLKKTQTLYEKLKQGLLRRDERIEELEEQISARSDLPEAVSTELKSEIDTAADELREQIAAHEGTIEKLRNELGETRDEKDMLADMAKRRSQNNRALKEANVEADAEQQKREDEIKTLSNTIGNREVSIKRLLDDVEQLKATNETQQRQLTKLTADVAAHQPVLAQRDDRIQTLESSLTDHQTQMATLDQDLDATRTDLQGAKAKLQSHEQTIALHKAEVDAAANASAEQVTQLRRAESIKAREHASAVEATAKAHDLVSTLDDELKDRENKMQALNTQIDSMRGDIQKLNLDAKSFRQQASAAQALVEEQNKELTADLLAREVHNAPQTDSRDLLDQRDALQLEVDEQEKARESGESTLCERDRQLSIANAKLNQATDELTEQHQSISVYKSVIDDQAFKLASLSEEVANLTPSRDLQKQTRSPPDQASVKPSSP